MYELCFIHEPALPCLALQTCRLGKHRPLAKVSRDGLVRVGEALESEQPEEDELVEQWFTGPWSGQHQEDNMRKLKLYAHACRQQLGERATTNH